MATMPPPMIVLTIVSAAINTPVFFCLGRFFYLRGFGISAGLNVQLTIRVVSDRRDEMVVVRERRVLAHMSLIL